MAFSDTDKTEILTHLRNIATRTEKQQLQIDTIEFRCARYLDTKISAVAEKVVGKTFPKRGLNEKGLPFLDAKGQPIMTSIGAELGWQDANFIGVRKKVDELKSSK